MKNERKITNLIKSSKRLESRVFHLTRRGLKSRFLINNCRPPISKDSMAWYSCIEYAKFHSSSYREIPPLPGFICNSEEEGIEFPDRDFIMRKNECFKYSPDIYYRYHEPSIININNHEVIFINQVKVQWPKLLLDDIFCEVVGIGKEEGKCAVIVKIITSNSRFLKDNYFKLVYNRGKDYYPILVKISPKIDYNINKNDLF